MTEGSDPRRSSVTAQDSPRRPRSRLVVAAWIVSGLVVFVLFVWGSGLGLMLAGLIFFVWGVVMALNYKGLADAMPRRWRLGPFWQETSPAMTRLIFGFFAFWGATVFVAGLSRII